MVANKIEFNSNGGIFTRKRLSFLLRRFEIAKEQVHFDSLSQLDVFGPLYFWLISASIMANFALFPQYFLVISKKLSCSCNDRGTFSSNPILEIRPPFLLRSSGPCRLDFQTLFFGYMFHLDRTSTLEQISIIRRDVRNFDESTFYLFVDVKTRINCLPDSLACV